MGDSLNLYLAIILGSLALSWLLGLASSLLDARAMTDEVPAELAVAFDADTYARSQQYARANMRFEAFADTFSFLTILGMILGGGFNLLDLAVRSLGLSPLWSGLAFIGAVAGASAILRLPFDLYHAFVLEKRFGFNATTGATFVMDRLKGLILATVLGGALLAGVLWFFGSVGETAWLWCWGVTVLFTLTFTYVAPTWILPLFNRFTPLEPGELRLAIETFAEKADFELSGIFVMDGSKRSTKANAFFMGLGARRRIALFDTLVEKLTVDEIVAVLAHEVGHSKRGHIKRRLATGTLKTGAVFYLMSLFLDNPELFAAFAMDHVSVYAGLVFFVLLYTPVSLALSVVANSVSRRHEYEADRFAVETVGGPEAMISALKKLSAGNLSNLTPHPLTVWLEYSHPPVVERIRALSNAKP